MSIYVKIKLLPLLGHWNRRDVANKIDDICKKLDNKSLIRQKLVEAKSFIEADNLSAAKERIDYVKNMKNLEEVVTAETKHFNFKKALATVLTVASLGMYTGNANAEDPSFHNQVGVQTSNGQVIGIQMGQQIFDTNGQKLIANVSNGQIVPVANATSPYAKTVIPSSNVNYINTNAADDQYLHPEKYGLKSSSSESSDSYSHEIRAIDEAIKKKPTSAELYIKKVEQQLKDHVSPGKIIETLETAISKYEAGKLKGTTKEITKLYAELVSSYNTGKNYGKSLMYLEKIKQIDPNYPSIEWSIKETKKYMKEMVHS